LPFFPSLTQIPEQDLFFCLKHYFQGCTLEDLHDPVAFKDPSFYSSLKKLVEGYIGFAGLFKSGNLTSPPAESPIFPYRKTTRASFAMRNSKNQ
jgi:hypothetical protein